MNEWSGLVPASSEWLALLPLALVAAWLERRAGRTRARAALRAVLVVLLVLAASRPSPIQTHRPMAVVVDTSASVDRPAAIAVGDEAAGGAAAARVITFGDGGASDLESALDLGAAALPAGGRMILASDGRATRGRAVLAAERARRAGVTVDVLPLPAAAGADAGVVTVEAPLSWRAGDPLPVAVTVGATQPLSTTLRLLRDDQIELEVPVRLEEGLQVVREQVPVPLGARGAVRLRAELVGQPDREPLNDAGHGLVQVAGPPATLVVGDGVAGVALADHLAREGVPAALVGPERAPVDAAEWAAYDAVVIVDMPADRMTAPQLAGLADHVRSGAGLLLTAGRQSFALGGWAGSQLAELSPLTLEPPDTGDRSPVALVLVVDRSASMAGAAAHPSVTKLDVAREAAALAVEVLAPGDEVGVVAYSDEPAWVVPMGAVASADELLRVRELLAPLIAEGGTRILPALQAGIDAAAQARSETRHVILLTDGQDASPDLAAFEAAAASARTRGVTLSTIALGPDADAGLLARLAEIGRGRTHLAPDAAALPQLTLSESRMVAGRSERAGAFRPVAAAEHPLVSGLDLNLPPLRGYLAMQLKPDAEAALETPAADPLLAVTARGLGTVAAWSSDTGEAWAREWVSDPGAASFWAAVVRRLARRPGNAGPSAAVTVEDGIATIRVDARDTAGAPLDLADVTAVLTATAASGSVDSPPIVLRQVAPGTYQSAVAAEPGAVPLAVTVEKDGWHQTTPTGWSWNGPAELFTFTGGEGQLAAIARAGGGSVLAGLPDMEAPARFAVPPWLVLVAAAALLWLYDVAGQMGVRFRRRRAPDPASDFAPGWGRS